jgi:hypothetical protein
MANDGLIIANQLQARRTVMLPKIMQSLFRRRRLRQLKRPEPRNASQLHSLVAQETEASPDLKHALVVTPPSRNKKRPKHDFV